MFRYEDGVMIQTDRMGHDACPTRQEQCQGDILPCAFCGFAFRWADGGCHNPACTACVHISAEAAAGIVIRRSDHLWEEAKRAIQRRAIDRGAAERARERAYERDQALREVEAAGQCPDCWMRYSKRIRHRKAGNCPINRAEPITPFHGL